MGLTIRCKGCSCNIGYRGFTRLKAAIAKAAGHGAIGKFFENPFGWGSDKREEEMTSGETGEEIRRAITS